MGDAYGTWLKVNRVICTGLITGGGAASEHELSDETFMTAWPYANRPLVEFAMASNGKALAPYRAMRIGRQNPAWQVKSGITSTFLALGWTSFCQDENYSTTLYAPRIAGNNTSARATLFQEFQTGMPGTVLGLLKVKGGVVTGYALDIPAPIDGEPGMPSMTLDYIGAAVDDTGTAFTTGAATVDTGSPLLSTDFTISLNVGSGAANVLFVSASISGKNNAKRSSNNEATASYITVGAYTFEGSITVVKTDGTGDAWDLLNRAHQAETLVTMVISSNTNNVHSQSHKVRIGPPATAPGDNVFLDTFAFHGKFDPAAPTYPTFSVTSADVLNYTT